MPAEGFVLAWDKCQAWYDNNGLLIHAEHIFPKGDTRQVKQDGPTWEWLVRQGLYEVNRLTRLASEKLS